MVVKEKVGIDQFKISGFTIRRFDKEKLNKEEVSVRYKKDMDGNVVIQYLKLPPNNLYRKFEFKRKKEDGIDKSIGQIEVVINADLLEGNLNNWSVDEVKEHVDVIQRFLKEEYGLYLNWDEAGFNYMEINLNLVMPVALCESADIWELLMSNLRNWKKHAVMEYSVIKNKKSNLYDKKELESIRLSTKQRSVTVYDKTRQMKTKKKNPVVLNQKVVRIELKLKNGKKVKEKLGSNKIYKIKQEDVIGAFYKEVGDSMLDFLKTKLPEEEKKRAIKIYNQCKNEKRPWTAIAKLVNKMSWDIKRPYLYDTKYFKECFPQNDKYKNDNYLALTNQINEMGCVNPLYPQILKNIEEKLENAKSGRESEVEIDVTTQSEKNSELKYR